MRPYSKAAIKSVTDRFNVSADFTSAERDCVMSQIADEIAAMPPVLQTIFIESSCAKTVTKGVGGDYSFGTGIRWGMNGFANDNLGLTVMQHELGHYIDGILQGIWQERAARGVYYASEENPAFINAMDHDLARIKKRAKKTSYKLYEGCSRLDHHLYGHDTTSGGYDFDKYPPESFAEMTAHYGRLYVAHSGDEALIDQALTATYPKLWGVYRGAAFTQIERIAKAMAKRRDDRITAYVDAAGAFHKALGRAPEAPEDIMSEAEKLSVHKEAIERKAAVLNRRAHSPLTKIRGYLNGVLRTPSANIS